MTVVVSSPGILPVYLSLFGLASADLSFWYPPSHMFNTEENLHVHFRVRYVPISPEEIKTGVQNKKLFWKSRINNSFTKNKIMYKCRFENSQTHFFFYKMQLQIPKIKLFLKSDRSDRWICSSEFISPSAFFKNKLAGLILLLHPRDPEHGRSW